MTRFRMADGFFGRALLALLAALLLSFSFGPAAQAHKEHQQEQQAKAEALAQVQAQSGTLAAPADARSIDPQAMHKSMGDIMETEQERAPTSFLGRLLDWLGRVHPIIVHFPIAFFPAALFTAVVGRKRPGFAAPVQFLVVAGGILAPVSALLGWFNGGWAIWDADPLLAVHRWLGTGIGIGGLLLAIWAWRRPSEDRRAGMIVSLSLMTVAIAVQGWFGGALVHGIDHLNW